MTPEAMNAMFESITGDTLDTTTENTLLNEVKDDIESEDTWEILKTLDESQSVNTGDTYLTMKSLPSDFALPVDDGIYVGTDIIPYLPIPYVNRIQFQSVQHRYYIDYASGKYAIMGSPNPGGTIHFFYHKFSPTLVPGTSQNPGTPWIFPARFHPIIPYRMAMKFFAIDQQEKARSWDDRWELFAAKIYQNMRGWNSRLVREAAQNKNLDVDFSTHPNVVNMDGRGNGLYG